MLYLSSSDKSHAAIFEDLDYETLKKYFEDKALMEKALSLFSKKTDEHLAKLRDVKHDDEYLKIEEEYKKYIEARIEIFEKKIGEGNHYKLSKKEFVDFAGEVMFGYSKSWEMGRNKFDYIKTIEQNKQFLELLK